MNDKVALALQTISVATLTAWIAAPAVIRWAEAVGAVDAPGPRKIHSRPIPRVGGVVVFFGFLAGLTYAAWATGVLLHPPKVTVYWVALAGAATCCFLLGLVDDLVGLSFVWKFAVQIAAAVTVWIGGFRIEILTSPMGILQLDSWPWSLAVTVFWIVTITNAINLIDGLDGLAAGSALITTSAVAGIAFYTGQVGVLAASIALVGSLLGFLRYNFNPARIFLGDSGSMFLGFVLAVISIRGSQKGPTAVAVIAPLLVLGLPIVDTGLAVLRRSWRIGRESMGEGGGLGYAVRNAHRIFLPERAHLHHKLLDLGFSHRTSVLVLYAGGGVLAMAAMASVVINSATVAIVLMALLVVFLLLFLSVLVVSRRRQAVRAADDKKAQSEADGGATPVARSGKAAYRG